MPERSTPAKRYERLEDRIRALIAQGVYPAGKKIPSVRRMGAQEGVSVTTVLEAYSRLEAAGLLEVRPQSGYYVRATNGAGFATPRTTQPAAEARPVTRSDFISRLFHDANDQSLVQFGAAVVHPSMMPLKALSRLMTRISRETPEAASGYDFPPGHLPLREIIARRAAACGCTFSPDDVLTTFGCSEALTVCLRAVTAPGDLVAVESPTYYKYLELFEWLQLRVLELPTSPDTGIAVEAVEDAVRHRGAKALVVVPNFSNPLGALMPDAKKAALAQLASEYDFPLVEDDIYGDLASGGLRPKPIKAFDTTSHVMLCASFSKTLPPGYRVGWAVPGRYHARVLHLKRAMTSAAAGTLPQMVLAEFARSGAYDRHLRTLRRQLGDLRAQHARTISDVFPPGTRLTRPKGGHLLWVEFPPGFDAVALHARALAHHISIAPGPMFTLSGDYGNCVRLNVGHPWDARVEHALEVLGRLAGEGG
jgi:DNA-binding transcriptional MocR family regulator